MTFDEDAKTIQWKKEQLFSTNDTEKLAIYKQKNEVGLFYDIQKRTQRRSKIQM